MRYRDSQAFQRCNRERKRQGKRQIEGTIDIVEIFQVLTELAREDSQSFTIPYETRDGRKKILCIGPDGYSDYSSYDRGGRCINQEDAEKIFSTLSDQELRPIVGGTIADRKLWSELCRSLDDSAIKLLDRIIKSVQQDISGQSAREMHFKSQDGQDHVLEIKKARLTDFRDGDHSVMMALDGKNCSDSDVLSILERASKIERLELVSGQRQLVLRQLQIRACMAATSLAKTALRQMRDGADCIGR